MPDRRRIRALAALAFGAVTLAGCAAAGRKESSAPRQPLPPQMVVPPPSTSEPAMPVGPADDELSAEPAAPATSRGSEPERRAASDSLIVIDPVEPEELRTPSLAEAAARERARRRDEPVPLVRITNENLSEHAAGGVLTIAHSSPEPAEEAAEEIVAEAAEREAFWRAKGLEIRQRWREAVDRIPELEERVADLRQQFYSVDDPAVRDGQIKPLWDKALADLEQARFVAAQGAEEVADFLEQGRRAGALPGWLREGAELEPEPVLESVDGGVVEHQAEEPSIYEPPPGV